jgi:hypothetical protein
MAKNTLKFYSDPLITGQDMSASFNGTPQNIEFYDNVGVQLSWTGASPGGTINIQVSLDYDPRFPTAGTWTLLQYPSGTAIVISPNGVAGTGYFDLNQLSAMWVQVVYTTAGGSVGLLSSKICSKGLQ